ncbi:unnamed protein product [Rangifer tarandus platyrhynchus]|uniref:Basic proline-rich protein-like n=2 Tax=Rangifer tarandus platyrhynchus TaxID=3082113 RepID=A0ABN8YHG1_RANTA|nr:unnamed protein product [Rangifer tarandus platyrhynchus]CAI9700308.1 unnamed protein product [Rangifer tarandus platyrhynchus]
MAEDPGQPCWAQVPACDRPQGDPAVVPHGGDPGPDMHSGPEPTGPGLLMTRSDGSVGAPDPAHPQGSILGLLPDLLGKEHPELPRSLGTEAGRGVTVGSRAQGRGERALPPAAPLTPRELGSGDKRDIPCQTHRRWRTAARNPGLSPSRWGGAGVPGACRVPLLRVTAWLAAIWRLWLRPSSSPRTPAPGPSAIRTAPAASPRPDQVPPHGPTFGRFRGARAAAGARPRGRPLPCRLVSSDWRPLPGTPLTCPSQLLRPDPRLLLPQPSPATPTRRAPHLPRDPRPVRLPDPTRRTVRLAQVPAPIPLASSRAARSAAP